MQQVPGLSWTVVLQCCRAAAELCHHAHHLCVSVIWSAVLQCCSAAVLRVCRVKTWPSKWLEGGVAECGGVTRLMMCTWHQHCSIYTICTICRTCTICTLCTIYTICTLATYLPISPRQTRAEVGLNTALGRVTLLSFLWRTRAETMGGSDEDLKHWIL